MAIRWVTAAGEQLPFPDCRFDGALLFTTIEFVADPGRVVKEAFRVIRPEGWVAVGYLNAVSPWVALYRHLGDAGQAPWTAARFFTRDDVEQLAGRVPDAFDEAVHLAPGAKPPLPDADAAGRHAGNDPALGLLLWRNTR
jgi:ubiquinone/menaquinone biosynthesis C-methylase UbiE